MCEYVVSGERIKLYMYRKRDTGRVYRVRSEREIARQRETEHGYASGMAWKGLEGNVAMHCIVLIHFIYFTFAPMSKYCSCS